MENAAIFTISKATDKHYNITSQKFNIYNKINIPEEELFNYLKDLADIFNNVFDRAILFEIE